mmetsp:Transcript_27904/g.30499  ORF Transcript_27904/g.30499 Transcript_27904/m.30499 type:complete len:293 (-) Transcript_27904:207-1085(-)
MMELTISDLKAEIVELKADVRRLEEKISSIEQKPTFKEDDFRYRRLVEEKHMLLEHLCQLRTNVYSKLMLQPTTSENSHHNNGNVKSEFPASKRQKTNNKRGFSEVNSEESEPAGEIEYYVDRKEHHQPVDSSVITEQSLVLASPSAAGRGNGSVAPPAYHPASQLIPPSVGLSAAPAPQTNNSQGSVGSSSNLPNNQPVPALQLEEYLETKMKLAQIMRDFNEKKICFIGNDGIKVFVQQYQQISARVKAGEDIANFLRGKVVMFVTAVDKKKRSITETKLFIPDFELIQR